MADYFNEKRLKRFRDALAHSRRKLAFARKEHREIVKSMVGKHYAEDGSQFEMPVNMMELFISIYARLLASSAPRVMVNTLDSARRSRAARFEVVLNDVLPRHLRIDKTLKLWVRNALLSVGILAQGIAPDGDTFDDGEDQIETGSLYCRVVSLDDFAYEIQARDLAEAGFLGYRFKMPLEPIKDSKVFKNTADLQAFHPGTDDTDEGEIRAEAMTRGEGDSSHQGEYRERVELWNMWFPEEGMTAIFPANASSPPIFEGEYAGPDPITILSFGDVPDQALPLAPASLLSQLNEFINSCMRKVMRGAENAKTVMAYQSAAAKDVERIAKAGNLSTVRVDNINAIKEISLNGPNAELLAAMLQSKELFDTLANNLSTLGGLSVDADTLGQEKMLSASAASRVLDMRQEVYKRTKGVIEGLAWWLWTDPLAEYTASFDEPPLGKFPVTLNADERDPEEFQFFDLDIVPYSMQDQSPEQKAETIQAFLERTVFPLLPMMAEQGVALRIESLFRTVARLKNIKELDDLLVFGDPAAATQGGQTYPAGQSPVTSRTTTRISRSGPRAGGEAGQLIESLMAQGNQPAPVGQ